VAGGSSVCGRAGATIGLIAPRAGPAVVRLASPRGVTLQTLYLSAGLVWYTIPAFDLPAVISASAATGSAAGEVYIAGVTVLPSDAGAAPAVRSAEGGAAILDLRLEGEAVVLEAWYASATAPRDLRVALVSGAVGAGKGFATDADPDRAFQAWAWRIRPDRPPEQAIDGRAVPSQSATAWPAHDGLHWVRLQFWRGQDLWLEVPVGSAEAQGGHFVSARLVTGLINVPLPEPPPAPPFAPGALLQGDGGHIFLLEAGTLRWVPTLETFQRRGYAWGQVQRVDEAALARWPVGLPLE
jgi:hypothetical protein